MAFETWMEGGAVGEDKRCGEEVVGQETVLALEPAVAAAENGRDDTRAVACCGHFPVRENLKSGGGGGNKKKKKGKGKKHNNTSPPPTPTEESTTNRLVFLATKGHSTHHPSWSRRQWWRFSHPWRH